MPIIIDANRAGDFAKPTGGHAEEILRRVSSRRMSVVVGGKLLKELSRTHLAPLISEWIRAGLAKRVPDDRLNIKEGSLLPGTLASNDPHVIALALESSARLIYTKDIDLIKDFKNIKLMNPKGKVVKPETKPKIAYILFDRLGA